MPGLRPLSGECVHHECMNEREVRIHRTEAKPRLICFAQFPVSKIAHLPPSVRTIRLTVAARG